MFETAERMFETQLIDKGPSIPLKELSFYPRVWRTAGQILTGQDFWRHGSVSNAQGMWTDMDLCHNIIIYIVHGYIILYYIILHPGKRQEW